MRMFLSALAVAAIACTTVAGASAQSMGSSMGSMKMSTAKPHCNGATGPMVWYVRTSHEYYVRGNAHYGKGKGQYLCRKAAMQAVNGSVTSRSGGTNGSAATMGSGNTMRSGKMHSSSAATSRSGGTNGSASTMGSGTAGTSGASTGRGTDGTTNGANGGTEGPARPAPAPSAT